MNAREVLEGMIRTDRGDMTVHSPVEVQTRLDAYRAEVLAADGQAYDGELAMLRGLVRTLRVVVRHDSDLAEVWRLLVEYTRNDATAREKATADAATATPTDTNRRARLLHQIADGGRWKSGDVVRWYWSQGLTELGTGTARRDLATLRDSGAITQHDESGVRFYTLNRKGGIA